jgi:hypothetical protein
MFAAIVRASDSEAWTEDRQARRTGTQLGMSFTEKRRSRRHCGLRTPNASSQAFVKNRTNGFNHLTRSISESSLPLCYMSIRMPPWTPCGAPRETDPFVFSETNPFFAAVSLKTNHFRPANRTQIPCKFSRAPRVQRVYGHSTPLIRGYVEDSHKRPKNVRISRNPFRLYCDLRGQV